MGFFFTKPIKYFSRFLVNFSDEIIITDQLSHYPLKGQSKQQQQQAPLKIILKYYVRTYVRVKNNCFN